MKETNWLHFGMTVPALLKIASVLPPPTFAHWVNVENPTSQAPPTASRTLLRRHRGRQTGDRTCPKKASSTWLVSNRVYTDPCRSTPKQTFRLNPFAVKRGGRPCLLRQVTGQNGN